MKKAGTNKKHWLSILGVAMSLGTAWAVRGQFGHEQGAAWAAAIGALALVAFSGRKDWYLIVLPVTLASAVGWGMGGMISYGAVVGYGRAGDFLNAGYGLLMLFVIGGLYGLIGGGLTGLTLESSKENKVQWTRLMTEMVAGGLIVYGFLVMQLEILMTPPRSEAWAFCLGAGLALLWYLARNNFSSSLRVAFITMLGAGFGFAFGNFLQITGTILKINFNMWNVMEYSIGFFGGLSLAYSVYRSKWPEKAVTPKTWENRIAFVIPLVIIPLIVFMESLSYETLLKRLQNTGSSEGIVLLSSIVSCLLICSVFLINGVKLERIKFNSREKDVRLLFISVLVAYVAVSFIVTGVFFGKVLSNHVLYVVNIFIVLLLLRKAESPFFDFPETGVSRRFLILLPVIIIVILLLGLILVNIHGEISGANHRFALN